MTSADYMESETTSYWNQLFIHLKLPLVDFPTGVLYKLGIKIATTPITIQTLAQILEKYSHKISIKFLQK